MSYFANLRIQKIVIHEIFKRNNDGEIMDPRYNDRFTLLDPLGLQTLQNRVVNALGDNSHSIEMDINNSNPDSTFQIGASLLSFENDAYIETSKRLVYKLAESQNSRSIPGGVVLIFSGITGLNNYPFWGIIKAEIQEGFVKEYSSDILLLKYITDLLLTPQQRLYKLGIFIEIGQTENSSGQRLPVDFKTYIYDHNMTRNETQHAAYYFYRDFLGCIYSPTDKKLTSDFYYETKNFIKTAELDDDDKNEINTALFTYIKVSQEQVIHTESFADEFLPTEEIKQGYMDFMVGKSFPTHAIGKDITYIRNKLKQRKVTFRNNVKILAPADNFNDLLSIQPDKERNQTHVIINALVENHD